MPFADGYVVSAHPPLPLHSKVPRPWALDAYSTVCTLLRFYAQCTQEQYTMIVLYMVTMHEPYSMECHL